MGVQWIALDLGLYICARRNVIPFNGLALQFTSCRRSVRLPKWEPGYCMYIQYLAALCVEMKGLNTPVGCGPLDRAGPIWSFPVCGSGPTGTGGATLGAPVRSNRSVLVYGPVNYEDHQPQSAAPSMLLRPCHRDSSSRRQTTAYRGSFVYARTSIAPSVRLALAGLLFSLPYVLPLHVFTEQPHCRFIVLRQAGTVSGRTAMMQETFQAAGTLDAFNQFLLFIRQLGEAGFIAEAFIRQ